MELGQESGEPDTISRKPTCAVCCGGDFVESLMWCDCCSKRHHTFCLDPPFVTIPDKRWLCPSCISRTLPSRKRKFANGAGGGGNNKRPAANGVHKPPGGRGRPRAAKQKAQASSSSQASENDGSHGAAAERERNQESSPPSMGLVGADIERATVDSSDPGTTITLFCRRDFKRYLRWKRKELASQDDEKRKEEQTRARKTFSSIIAKAV